MPLRIHPRVGAPFLAAVWLATAVAACGGDDSTNAGHPPKPPNIVVVETDDQAVDTMRAMPYTQRAIGERGVDFTDSLVSFPLCCPSRATFLTGQYAHNTGVLDNGPPNGGLGALDQKHTLPVWLSQAGYRTGFVGKYLNGYGTHDEGGRHFVPPGWSYWVAAPAGHKKAVFDYDLSENGKTVHYGNAERDYKTDVFADRAADFIDSSAKGDRPFFLWVATSAPHLDNLPLTAPRDPAPAPRDAHAFEHAEVPQGPAFDEPDVSDKPKFIQELPRLTPEDLVALRRTYISQLESLVAVDDLVHKLVDRLRATGELGRTLIIFTSDNGFMRGQHRITSGKSVPYGESVGVPLLVRGPGFPSGKSFAGPVVNADLAPTILRLAGGRADVPIDGLPLTDAVHSKEPHRQVLLEVQNRKADSFHAVETKRWLYVRRETDRSELYDLRKDPGELENVTDDPAYAETRARLDQAVRRLEDCSGRDCR